MISTGNQLEPGEEVIASLQDHWISMGIPLFIYFSGWLFFCFLFFLATFFREVSNFTGFLLLFIAFCILLGAHHFFFLHLIEYLVSTVVITNRRLMQIRFFPFFLDDVSYTEIDKIHEIDKKKHGFLQNVLNYGDVCMQTPNETITLQYVRSPRRFIDAMELIKTGKSLTKDALKGMGADCPKKYKYLLG